jgi:hypothetical protein
MNMKMRAQQLKTLKEFSQEAVSTFVLVNEYKKQHVTVLAETIKKGCPI